MRAVPDTEHERTWRSAVDNLAADEAAAQKRGCHWPRHRSRRPGRVRRRSRVRRRTVDVGGALDLARPQRLRADHAPAPAATRRRTRARPVVEVVPGADLASARRILEAGDDAAPAQQAQACDVKGIVVGPLRSSIAEPRRQQAPMKRTMPSWRPTTLPAISTISPGSLASGRSFSHHAGIVAAGHEAQMVWLSGLVGHRPARSARRATAGRSWTRVTTSGEGARYPARAPGSAVVPNRK